jgi:hypothetical protein
VPAIGALQLLYLCAHALELGRRQRSQELLLAQELKERRQPPGVLRAAEVLKRTRFAHVMGQRQLLVAAGARQVGGHRAPVVAMLADLLEQFDDRSGGELRAFALIEPDQAAREAQIHAQRADRSARQVERLHRLGAARAMQKVHCVSRLSLQRGRRRRIERPDARPGL